MSAIVGLWHLDGRPVENRILARMSAALAHRGPDGERIVARDAFGMAHRHCWVTPEEVGERQPLEGPGGTLLALDGRVDNRDELVARLGLPRTASDAACVLAACGAWGDAALERLSGDFAFAWYDSGRGSLMLARDAIGLRPLYYHHGPGLFAFASEIKGLLAHPAIPSRPDDEGLADYLLLGARPVDRLDITCFQGVLALPPAHLLRVSLRGPEPPRHYWDFDPRFDPGCRSFGECAEAFRERFAEAVRRRVRSAYPVAVSVSGGLDSSSIFCQARSLGRSAAAACPSVLGFSYIGAEGSTADERRYLDEIERAEGVTIERLAAAPLLGMVDGAELQARHAEAPLLDSLWQITQGIQSAAARAGARRFITGHWGDQMLHDTAYLVDLVRRLSWGTVRRHLNALDQWFQPDEANDLRKQLARDLLRYHVPPVLLPLAKRLRWVLRREEPGRRWLEPGFRARALRQANRPATAGRHLGSAQARSLYLEARVKYSVQCMEWNNKISALYGLDYATPFLDRDLIQFLMAVPGAIQTEGGVPRALLRQGLAGILPEAIRQRRWKGDYSEPVNLGAARDLEAVRRLFADAPRAVALGYVDRGRLGGELDALALRLQGPDCLASWELMDLIGLEAWLRVFFSPAVTEGRHEAPTETQESLP
jgi:asparagine synthase (glutamine-hydrolysing)